MRCCTTPWRWALTLPEQVQRQCKALLLATAAQVFAELLAQATRESWPIERFAAEWLSHELEGRHQHRIARLSQEAQLPPGKTLAALNQERLPLRSRRLLADLCRGDCLDRADNVLLFGLPGRGKTHVAAAIGHELVQQGRTVRFTATYALVGRLLRAKRNLELERELRRLDRGGVVLRDDLGYVQAWPRGEGSLVYLPRGTLRAAQRDHHLEPRLLRLGAQLPGSADHDGIVGRHSVILEFGADVPSLRAEAASARQQAERPTPDSGAAAAEPP